ncbi:unnamed protein product [Caenorhabditis brenneri]
MNCIFLVLLFQISWISPISTQPSSSFPTRDDEEKIFQMMFDAQNLYRNNNYRKSMRSFEIDWEKCDERYKWPECCLWSEKKKFKRETSKCRHIKGDVILETNRDVNYFQTLVDLETIQGSLVIRNTTIPAFGMPELRKIGFSGRAKDRQKAALVVENNPNLIHFRLRRLDELVKHKSQKYAVIRNNSRLWVDAKQYEILKKATGGKENFEQFKPPRSRYIRDPFYELWPYFLFGFMIMIVFFHHFVMLEVNEARVKRKEQELIDCIVKMRDSTLAAELLIQTPSDITLAFDMDVLHLCTDQTELVKQIEKLLNADVKAFKDISLEEVSAKDGAY